MDDGQILAAVEAKRDAALATHRFVHEHPELSHEEHECAEPGFQQIVLHDAPAVLGWERWREIAAANGLGLIEASLIAAIEAGEIRPLPVKPTAHLLLGALDEAAMLIGRSSDPAGRAEITTVLLALIDSFAAPLPGHGTPS